MIALLSKFKPYLIMGGVMLLLAAWGTIEHNRFLREKAEHQAFVAETKALGEIAKREKERKEREYAENIRIANASRDDALAKLRDHQERARVSRVSITPETSGNKLCFDRARFDDSLQQFLGEVEELLARGDLAIVDSKTWQDSWPR